MDTIPELEGWIIDVQELEKKLPQSDVKWNYPRDVILEIQNKAKHINKHFSGDLDRLLHWPRTKELEKDGVPYKDYRGFYDMNWEARFNRTSNWFVEMGFTKHETPYTIANNWDRAYVNATFLVPDHLKDDDNVPVMWFFHGGGFVAGAGDHIPWYSQSALRHAHKNKAIVIAPDYPLGPEANYKDIFDALHDFLTFYKLDGCFEPGHTHWTQWLNTQINKAITIDKSNIFIEGESAGGHAIITTLFLNAERARDFKLPIKAVMLRYPMIRHYTRSYPVTETGKITFMNAAFGKDEIYAYAKGMKNEIARLESITVGDRTGFVRTRTKGYAPEYMWASPVLTIAGEWKGMFRRIHGTALAQEDDEVWSWDCLERVERMKDLVDEELLPPIVAHHAHDDTNCPVKDTWEFKELLHDNFPGRYLVGDEMVKVIEVKQLQEPDGVKGKEPSTAVGHGYDYWQENEPFQIECFDFVSRFWLQPC